jgi:hypothetical protein
MKFTTDTGSVYEVDPVLRMVRRVSGMDEPTSRVGKDGEWRTYLMIPTPVVGQGVVIAWGLVRSPDDYTIVQCTQTSPVATIEPGQCWTCPTCGYMADGEELTCLDCSTDPRNLEIGNVGSNNGHSEGRA